MLSSVDGTLSMLGVRIEKADDRQRPMGGEADAGGELLQAPPPPRPWAYGRSSEAEGEPSPLRGGSLGSPCGIPSWYGAQSG
eukprot:CAMPEP_0115507120 /NCGR_PEP_ID=MMETSP0271-20121206/71549_1 /TAXON_ID=71861 /ORGANISM="Scrippsiella trochoidea, Strain CCMP3099" /LENGTH=81 /DNA_ID=CAMNT_0002936675 /DNA_START=12 /DNA_END=254 /DNA_ORIENTATION=+